MTRVLIVGAGALGQVFGRHLALGGAEVTFLVKQQYAESARAGFTLFQLSVTGGRRRERFEDFAVITRTEDATGFDQIWLAISSDALRGAWLAELFAVIGQATLVVLQPGIEERELVLSQSLTDRVVFGLPAIASYHAPLPGEQGAEGMAYLLPPIGKSVFSGPGAGAIAALLRDGGMPAAVVGDAVWEGVVPTSVIISFVAALELCGWSFARAARSEHLDTAARAARQAMVVAARRFGRRPPFVRLFVRALVMKIIGALAKRFAPFDVETYLEVHFTKTGPQTRLLLESFAEVGRDKGVPVDALVALRRALSD